MIKHQETTDITLFVRTGGEESDRWNRQRIVDGLLKETDIDYQTAEAVSKEVERQILTSGITRLTTALIREMVDARLVERGLEQARRQHATLGFPMYDVRQLLLHENKENANVPHSPEGTNLILAEGIKRGYALHDVFSPDVCDAHVSGDIHLHGLGYVDRPYSSCHLLEHIKMFGLDLPHALTVAHPARHAEVLLAHMVRFSAVLQGLFGSLISWDMVNISFAPYLMGMSEREINQFAQMLIYEFSQLTSTRGGQALFTDIHLYWAMPREMAETKAIGPGGVYTGRAYGEYEKEARVFARAIFEVYKKGDARDRPFIFPRPLVHITEDFFRTEGHEDFLCLISAVAEEKGNTCFVFDRTPDQPSLLKPAKEQAGYNPEEATEQWSVKSAAMHQVTINLPRLGYQAKGDESRLFSLLNKQLALALKSHLEKREFIIKLLGLAERGPLSVLSMRRKGFPYLRLDRSSYLIGMVGLNELVKIQLGVELTHQEEAMALGLKILKHMKGETEKLSVQTGLPLALIQTEEETTSYRFARLDLKMFSPPAGGYVQGNITQGGIYYTHSTRLPVSANVSFFKRADAEGLFHPFLAGGATTTLHLGSARYSPQEVARLVREVFVKTFNRQILLSPEFTICFSCGKTSRGLADFCAHCQSGDVDGIARITQYFSRTSGWNRGKLAELHDRNRAARIFY